MNTSCRIQAANAAFWAEEARLISWFSPWKELLEWHPPHAKWFIGGTLNACYNCLDRHMESETRQKIAFFWEGERGESREFSYEDLYREVNRFSNVLKNLGVKKGDKIAIYLPMIPEAVIAMLSAARIGAVHTVVFGGFSADALSGRINDAEAKVLITADGAFRKGKNIPLKETADRALLSTSSIEKVIVIRHTGALLSMKEERDFWYHELINEAQEECPCEEMDPEDELFILYTSGTTGKPKGIVHTTGGYLVGANSTTRYVFAPTSEDIYWCTADVGWITGHTYVVYGPLSNGMTQILYEGAMDFPDRHRVFRLIEKYGISILYTAPTAIRMFMKWGKEYPLASNLLSLRLLGSVGEPINPEAWNWYYTYIGNKHCPIVDTWWQTETGSIMISPPPVQENPKPGCATKPLPGIEALVLNENGEKSGRGYLAITAPWPSMLRGIYKDPVRYKEAYWSKWGGKYYFTGDGAVIDEDGDYWLLGRVDDVINVSGHRLGTSEIESALVDYPTVAEAAAVGVTHPIKGQAIVAFVTLKEGIESLIDLEHVLKEHVVSKIGSFARPERVIFSADLPKTRSGKIMRRLLRDIGEGRIVGDTTTLSDPFVVEKIRIEYQKTHLEENE